MEITLIPDSRTMHVPPQFGKDSTLDLSGDVEETSSMETALFFLPFIVKTFKQAH